MATRAKAAGQAGNRSKMTAGHERAGLGQTTGGAEDFGQDDCFALGGGTGEQGAHVTALPDIGGGTIHGGESRGELFGFLVGLRTAGGRMPGGRRGKGFGRDRLGLW